MAYKRKRSGSMYGARKRRYSTYRRGGTWKRAPRRGITGGYTRYSSLYSGRFSGQGAERKFKDTEMHKDAAQDIQTAGGIMGTEVDPDSGINFVEQGPAAYQRIGSRFSIHELHVKAVFERLPTEEMTNPEQLEETRVRIAIVLDKQCNGASTTFQTVFNNDVGFVNPGDSSPVDWFQRVENNKRFLVLWDKVMTLRAPFITNDGDAVSESVVLSGAIARCSKVLKFKTPIVIEMGATDAEVANVKSNNLICCVASDQSNTLTGPTVSVLTRIVFTDR